MGTIVPKHIGSDMEEMSKLRLDDVFVAMQENDFIHFPGKIKFTPKIAVDHGIRPLAIFWGALNLFGGGRTSHFLLDHPEGHQVALDGSYRAEGCYVNPICVGRVKEMIDTVATAGFQGYFIDEPTPLVDCYCRNCRLRFRQLYDNELTLVPQDLRTAFRHQCVVDYIAAIVDYCKSTHPQLETMACLMPVDKSVWQPAANIANLDNLGTDIYWVNDDNSVEEMMPIIDELGDMCRQNNKRHHEWLQCWYVKKGQEYRIAEQGQILLRTKPDALYVWAWNGQMGTAESCEDPLAAWNYARQILLSAKEL